MGLATKTYQLKLRNMLIVDNKSTPAATPTRATTRA
jgi:hypothetical protein